MGLFRKSTPPSVQSVDPDEPVWLIRTHHQVVGGAWVYQVIRGPRSTAEQFGILPWDTLPGVEQTAKGYMNHERLMHAVIGITLRGQWNEWDLPCPQPPVPGIAKPLDAAQMVEYQQLLESALTGEEQSRLSPEELQAYLDVQLHDVPMASWQKPDICGLHEGDRVRFIKDYDDEISYKAGSKGTIIIPSTAPAQIRLYREIALLHILMDDEGSAPAFIRAKLDEVERIPGHADVVFSDDGYVSVSNVSLA